MAGTGRGVSEGLLGWDGAAEYLSTSQRHVRTLVDKHRIAHIKVGGLIRFRVSDLDAYIDAQRVEAAP